MNQSVETLNRWGEGFSTFAWPMLWQSSLLIAIILAFDLMFARRIRASVRYALWLVVLVKLLLPPALSLPTSATWWLWRPHPAVETPVIQNYTVSFGNSVPEASLPLATVPVVVPAPKLNAEAWALLAMAAMGGGLLSWLTFRWLRVAAKVRGAPAAPAELDGILEEARQLAGLRRPLRLKLIDDRQSPAVCGLLRPVILLPQTLANQLAVRQLRAVLLHEAMHLRRGDVWVNFAQTLLQIAYWWHPLLWVANARIRRVREEAVDDAVMLALRDSADAYAPTLLEVAKFAFRRPMASLGLIGILESRSALRQRVERLVDFQPSRRTGLTILSLCGIFAFSAVALPMGQGPATDVPTASPANITVTRYGNAVTWQANSALDHALALEHEVPPLSRPKSASSYITLTSQTNANPGHPLSIGELDFIHLDQFGPFHHAALSVVIDKLSMKDSYVPILTTSKLLNGSQTLIDMPEMTNVALSDVLEAIVSGATPPIRCCMMDRYIVFFPFPQSENLNDELFDPITGTKVIVPPDTVSKAVDFTSVHRGSPQFVMRTFKINGTFISKLRSGDFDIEPKGSLAYTAPSGDARNISKMVEQFFLQLGVEIVPPKTVYYNEGHGVLFVYATQQDQAVIEKAIKVLSDDPPIFHVQAYQIDGETFLPPEKLAGTLTNCTGTVGMAEVQLEIRKLQDVYRQAGYTNVKVLLPQQRLTNGIIHLKAVIVGSKDGPTGKAMQNSSDDPPQVHIKARFIEVPKKFFSSAAAESLPPGLTNGAILTAPESKRVLRLLESQKGAKELAEPELTTFSGRQARIQARIGQPAPANSLPIPYLPPKIDPFETIPGLDVVPIALSDGYTVDLSVTATCLEIFRPLGIRPTLGPTKDPAIGRIEPIPAPTIQVSQATVERNLFDGQTLVLLPAHVQQVFVDKMDEKSQEEVAQYIRDDKVVLVLCTPTLIDPAGNRTHSDYYDTPYQTPMGVPAQLP